MEKMKYAVAVSGGIDSVVLLDLMAHKGHQCVVLHFDHGMRGDSWADAQFVEALARRYGFLFEGKREELLGANEAIARQRRYAFLLAAAEKHGAQLVTAHHLDDVVETIALNIARGTRWRGLAVLGDSRIMRPLTYWTKQQLTAYAVRRRLEWVEDETNASDVYTRNRLRRKLMNLPDGAKQQLYNLWQEQLELAEAITDESTQLLAEPLNRYFFISIDMAEAVELLAEYLRKKFATSLLTSQLERAVMALKTGKSGTVWQIGEGLEMKLSLKTAIIKKIDLGRKDFSEYGGKDAEQEWQE